MSAPAERSVEVTFFALLREQAGCDRLALTTRAASARELYAELQARLGLQLSLAVLRVAVNGRYAALDDALRAGDRIVFIPPVAGG